MANFDKYRMYLSKVNARTNINIRSALRTHAAQELWRVVAVVAVSFDSVDSRRLLVLSAERVNISSSSASLCFFSLSLSRSFSFLLCFLSLSLSFARSLSHSLSLLRPQPSLGRAFCLPFRFIILFALWRGSSFLFARARPGVFIKLSRERKFSLFELISLFGFICQVYFVGILVTKALGKYVNITLSAGYISVYIALVFWRS